MKKFKYIVGGLSIRSTPDEQQKILDKMGGDGLELVSVLAANGYFMFYFKKEIGGGEPYDRSAFMSFLSAYEEQEKKKKASPILTQKQ